MTVVERQHESVLVHANAPLRMRAEFRDGNGAGEQLERTALAILHPGRGRERENGALAAEIAGQFEVAQRDGNRRWICQCGSVGGGQRREHYLAEQSEQDGWSGLWVENNSHRGPLNVGFGSRQSRGAP